MEVIFMLIGFSLLVAIIFILLFIWAVKSGQFDDQYTPSIRVLFDEKKSTNQNQTTNQKNRDE
ncbi:cbb3-type cytochrome oxidase assembly protein CcoS [Rhodohalobacter sp. 614A]|uniref:cbb3-type cytochrome oxidase assembly protein CcoS n=1 Tax=Rhodohalobacter sp. 614A TaxID=2908649 RepID=UPI001F45DFE5|nr:cbb3-type cytochrome oxidase assembly protein CcoS [Rhodohalobacter sp. 614A]